MYCPLSSFNKKQRNMLACEFKKECWSKLNLFLLLDNTLNKQKQEQEVLHQKAILHKICKTHRTH